MTFSQAIDSIQERAGRVVVERAGRRLGPLQVMAMASQYFPDVAEKLWSLMEAGTIDPEGYRTGWIQLLENLEQQVFVQRVEAQLKNLQTG